MSFGAARDSGWRVVNNPSCSQGGPWCCQAHSSAVHAAQRHAALPAATSPGPPTLGAADALRRDGLQHPGGTGGVGRVHPRNGSLQEGQQRLSSSCCTAPPNEPVTALPSAPRPPGTHRRHPVLLSPPPDPRPHGWGRGSSKSATRGARSGVGERERPPPGETRGRAEMRVPQGNGAGPALRGAGGQDPTRRYRRGRGRAVRTGAPGHKESPRAAAGHSGGAIRRTPSPLGTSVPPPAGHRRHPPGFEAAPGSPRGKGRPQAPSQRGGGPAPGEPPGRAALRKAPRAAAGPGICRDPARSPRSAARPRNRRLPPPPCSPEPRSAGLLPALKLRRRPHCPHSRWQRRRRFTWEPEGRGRARRAAPCRVRAAAGPEGSGEERRHLLRSEPLEGSQDALFYILVEFTRRKKYSGAASLNCGLLASNQQTSNVRLTPRLSACSDRGDKWRHRAAGDEASPPLRRPQPTWPPPPRPASTCRARRSRGKPSGPARRRLATAVLARATGAAKMADGAGSNGDAAALPVGREAGERPGAGGRPGGRPRGSGRAESERFGLSAACFGSGAADPGERAHLHRGAVQGVQRAAHLRVAAPGALPGEHRAGRGCGGPAGPGNAVTARRARSTPTRCGGTSPSTARRSWRPGRR